MNGNNPHYLLINLDALKGVTFNPAATHLFSHSIQYPWGYIPLDKLALPPIRVKNTSRAMFSTHSTLCFIPISKVIRMWSVQVTYYKTPDDLENEGQ